MPLQKDGVDGAFRQDRSCRLLSVVKPFRKATQKGWYIHERQSFTGIPAVCRTAGGFCHHGHVFRLRQQQGSEQLRRAVRPGGQRRVRRVLFRRLRRSLRCRLPAGWFGGQRGIGRFGYVRRLFQGSAEAGHQQQGRAAGADLQHNLGGRILHGRQAGQGHRRQHGRLHLLDHVLLPAAKASQQLHAV